MCFASCGKTEARRYLLAVRREILLGLRSYCRSLIGCAFVPRDGAIYCAQCADLDLHVTDDVIKVKVGEGGASTSASNKSLTGASRDNNVIRRQAAIMPSHAPPLAALLPAQSPDGSSSYFAGCSQDDESPRRGHVTARRRGCGRGFAASHGTTSRYLDEDEDSDQSDVYQVEQHRARPVRLSDGCPARRPSASSRRQPPSRPSPGRVQLSGGRTRPGGPEGQRRRAKPRVKTRRGVLTVAARGLEGYSSDTPTASADANVRCSGYSSDSIDPTSASVQQRRRRVVSTAAQTTGNDVTEATGSGSGGRVMSEAVKRYLEAAAAWDERRRCSTCSSSSSDSSSEFDYYLEDRPLSTSGLGWSSSPLHAAPKCSSAVKQCVVS